MKVAVIGGGASGLVTLKFLLHAHEYFPIPPVEARLFEADGDIGGTFVQRIYEDAELVSSKYLTAFSDFRLPRDAPDFITPGAYVQYLRDYATKFNLWDAINLNATVQKVNRDSTTGGHIVEFLKTESEVERWACDAIAVCSGLNVTPRIPQIRGLDRIPTVFHSSQVKTREQFGQDTNVVVLGAGETSMDMAHLAVTSPTKSVTICHRGGFFCGPKIVPIPRGTEQEARSNKPVDTCIASLFDTAYVHPALQRGPLLWLAYDQWIKNSQTLISGTEEGPDQWVGHMGKERKHADAIFFCKSDRALPYISAGHRSKSWWNRMRASMFNVYIKETNGRKIDVMSWPQEVDDEGCMTLKDETGSPPRRIKPDVVVLATGYETKFPFLGDGYPALADTDVRCVYQSGSVDVSFIGFVRPSLGGIPPLAELQAQFWVLRLLQSQFPSQVPLTPNKNSLEPYEMDWKLHARAGYDLFSAKRGVDHESYAYQLALDMGSAPTISFVASKGLKVLYTWAMGSNFNPKFRLVGPWKWEDGAAEIMATELFDVVKRPGGCFYIVTYTIVPFFVFGAMSLTLYAFSGLARAFKGLSKALLEPLRAAKINGKRQTKLDETDSVEC
ncbi:hypothetical protein ACO1O0_006598 [Amphichorda felina]